MIGSLMSQKRINGVGQLTVCAAFTNAAQSSFGNMRCMNSGLNSVSTVFVFFTYKKKTKDATSVPLICPLLFEQTDLCKISVT